MSEKEPEGRRFEKLTGRFVSILTNKWPRRGLKFLAAAGITVLLFVPGVGDVT